MYVVGAWNDSRTVTSNGTHWSLSLYDPDKCKWKPEWHIAGQAPTFHDTLIDYNIKMSDQINDTIYVIFIEMETSCHFNNTINNVGICVIRYSIGNWVSKKSKLTVKKKCTNLTRGVLTKNIHSKY